MYPIFPSTPTGFATGSSLKTRTAPVWALSSNDKSVFPPIDYAFQRNYPANCFEIRGLAPMGRSSVRANFQIVLTMETGNMSALNSLQAEFAQAATYAQKQETIERHCEVLPIDSPEEIADGELLLAISEGKQYLLFAESPALGDGYLRVSSAMDGSKLAPLPIEKVALSIQRSKLHRLVLIGPNTLIPTTGPNSNDPPEYESKITIQQRDQILDSGAFSQLVDAAQRSGIVPGIGIIIQVRDCEFRLGKYHQALQLIESLLSAFVGSATQRMQRLKREEQDIASGRVKLSPKDLQAKRARDNKATECVERAKLKFTRVLEGIRAIIQLENEREQKN